MSEFLNGEAVNMIGLSVGIVGLLIAAYQTYSAHSAKRLYRNGCRIRCRDASDKAQRLADNVAQLCMAMNSTALTSSFTATPASAKAYAELYGHVGAALDVAKDWVRFCARLNEEHQDEFKESALTEDQLKRLRAVRNCLAELEAEHSHPAAGEGPVRADVA